MPVKRKWARRFTSIASFIVLLSGVGWIAGLPPTENMTVLKWVFLGGVFGLFVGGLLIKLMTALVPPGLMFINDDEVVFDSHRHEWLFWRWDDRLKCREVFYRLPGGYPFSKMQNIFYGGSGQKVRLTVFFLGNAN